MCWERSTKQIFFVMNDSVSLCLHLSLAVERSEGVFLKVVAKCLIGISGKIDLNKSHKLTQIHMEHFRRNYLSGKFLLQRPESLFVGSLGGKNGRPVRSVIFCFLPNPFFPHPWLRVKNYNWYSRGLFAHFIWYHIICVCSKKKKICRRFYELSSLYQCNIVHLKFECCKQLFGRKNTE